MNKKGQLLPFDALSGLVLPLLIIGMVFGIGLIIMSEMREQQASVDGCCTNGTMIFDNDLGYCCKLSGTTKNCSGTSAAQRDDLTPGCIGTGDVMDSISSVPGWLSIFVIVIIGGVLLALIALFRNR